MKMKKSQLKEAVKAIVRQTLSERLQREERSKVASKPSTRATGQSKQLAERIAKLFATRTGKRVNPKLFQQIAEEAVARPTLPPHKGSYKKVAPHAYTNTGENEPLTIQTDPQVNENEEEDARGNEGEYIGGYVPGTKGKNKFVSQSQLDNWRKDRANPRPNPQPTGGKFTEGDDKWIQKAVKHPGRCAHMGSPECPEGSPQYNLAKRFKSGDIHKDNTNEAGMTSEAEPFGGEEPQEPQFGGEEAPDTGEEEPQAFGGEEPPELGAEEHGEEDEEMEIKLIKLMGLCAKKLELMHQGIPGDETSVSLPPEVEEPSSPEDLGDEEEEPEVPFKKPEGKKEKKSKSEGEPKKEKKSKKEEDPTEFTKKLAKESSYKVQKRSYRTSQDTPYADPKNVQDPEIPGT